MTVYTLKEDDKKLATLLDEAITDGEVRIQGEEGRMFVLKPAARRSPLDVEGVNIGISREEIVSIVRESRER
jgi:hypothetical protein